MISTVHGRTHQVHGTGVTADVFLMGMLLMDGLCHQAAIGSHHKTSKLRINSHISHSGRNQNLLINPADALANHPDIIFLLIRAVGNPDTTGKVDKTDVRPGLFPKLHRQFKEDLGQHRIILIGHGIACQKRMDTESFGPFLH